MSLGNTDTQSYLALFTGAIRATAYPVSVKNGSLPFMALLAYPPGFLSRIWGDITWGQTVIPGWVPFLSQRWIYRFKTVIIAYSMPSTVRAASSLVSTRNGSLPFMALLAYPPGFLVRIWGDIAWGQTVIPGWVPLLSQRWIYREQTVSNQISHFRFNNAIQGLVIQGLVTYR